ncbi:MAG TPA: hypothetical protein VE524_06815 [Nitrososphaeraceae archaeon]|jgi:hypothetical protein|nr:hypothetical protein [Nitrososphaeraceae archaeon]
MDGKHSISTDSVWYLISITSLQIPKYGLSSTYSSYKKSMIERTIHSTSRIELNALMTIFHIKGKRCKQQHIRNWFNHFIGHHNMEMMTA